MNPRPTPAPWRAVTPMEGARTSSRANTAAATRAREAISSRGRDFLGMNTAAMATARPSTRYFRARLTNSPTLKSMASILVSLKKITPEKVRKEFVF